MLKGIVELDDTYLGKIKKGGKRGHGTAKNKFEVAISKDEEGKPQYAKMQIDMSPRKDAGVNHGQQKTSDTFMQCNTLFSLIIDIVMSNYISCFSQFVNIKAKNRLRFCYAQITSVPCHIDGSHLAVNTKLLVNVFEMSFYRSL